MSSDKTQLTLFGNKTAYPVYLTIGNLPKEIRRKPSRRGQILLGYLPTSCLTHISNKSAWRRTLANLFHFCMAEIVKPLHGAGHNRMKVVSGDGIAHRGHPIYAVFIGDYPKQLLVTCCKNGECPTCKTAHDDLGLYQGEYNLCDIHKILRALDTLDKGPTAYARACHDAGIKPVVRPFWQDLPYSNIYQSITPDILHQAYQGVVRHLIGWVKTCCGADEVDVRCCRLPPNHNIRLFMKGITTLSRVTGKEHAQMCSFLLALVVDVQLPNNVSPQHLI
jgi:hypothetical protein